MKMTDINNFSYALPQELIAQNPAEPRESARLMVLDRHTQSITHQHVYNLPDYFQKGDVLVINNTKVFHARLISGNKELFLLRPTDQGQWIAIGKHLTPGSNISFADDFVAHIEDKQPDGTVHVSFSQNDVITYANRYGEVPIPPYIKTIPRESDYQTSYAKIVGSVAAPTAGFHLTPSIRKHLTDLGVTIAEITLHVGLGTFLPVKTKFLEEHTMHSEWVQISDHVAKTINQAKSENRRIIAAGTTTVRTLEGVTALQNGVLTSYTGDINLFITPGYSFRMVDGIITNFHLPKSTLIVLVSSFAGRSFILRAYEIAVKEKYRFYSFGDAMFIV